MPTLPQRLHSLAFISGRDDYDVDAELAIRELLDMGPPAVPILVEAFEDTAAAEIPVKCYDQGAYIGDYANRTVVVRDLAIEALRRLSLKHRSLELHTLLIDLAEKETRALTRAGLSSVIKQLGRYWSPELEPRRKALLQS